MARTGVSYKEVTAAALQLVGQGRNPTVEQVRLLLGTGSSTTIANHLRQWKVSQETDSLISIKENIPAELVAVMKGLWEKVINHSEQEVSVIEKKYQQITTELEQELEKYKSNNQRWQKLFNQWNEEKNQLTTNKTTLEQALEFSHKENNTLIAKHDSFLQQLQNKQERIDELHKLHKQTQDNLEHYRESTREQRLLDQQQHEQHKQQFQSEIKNLNEQLVIQRDKTSTMQQQLQSSQQNYTLLEQRHAQSESQLEKLKEQWIMMENEKNIHLQAREHWQNQYQDIQKVLENKNLHFIDIQAEVKMLSQQLSATQQSLQDALNKNKLFSHEKLELTHENAQLQGQLKQLQKMITA